MSEVMTLWRGDFERIDHFRFRRTNSYCQVGQGIYLTDSQAVARSYQEKGADHWRKKKRLLWSDKAKDRMDAYEKAFPQFIELQEYRLTTGHFSGLDVHHFMEALKRKWRPTYEKLIEEGNITAKYLTKKDIIKSRMTTVKSGVIEVHLHEEDDAVGHLSRFDFPKDLEAKIFHVDKAIRTRAFWITLAEEGVVNVPPSARIDYAIDKIDSHARFDDLTPREQVMMRRMYQKKGFLGYEYFGGAYVGGYGPHRAFCLWDERFVNQHRRHPDGRTWES